MAGTASHHREGHRVSESKILMHHNLMIPQILAIRRLHNHYHGTPNFVVHNKTNCNDSFVQNDYPALKAILIGGCALFAALQRE